MTQETLDFTKYLPKTVSIAKAYEPVSPRLPQVSDSGKSVVLPDNAGKLVKQAITGQTVKDSDWLTLADIRDCFDRTEQGSQSCDRYLRFLRADGYKIEKRRRENSNCWEYKLLR
jgi:hypothetical protein